MSAIAPRLENITSKSALRLNEVAKVLRARPETISRWNQGKAFPHPTTERNLLELEWLVDQLADLYEPQETRLWLMSRQRLLDGQVPLELISEGKLEPVLDVVRRLREGTFI